MILELLHRVALARRGGVFAAVFLCLCLRASAEVASDDLWLKWGVPPVVRYPPETTGVASRVLKIVPIPDGVVILNNRAPVISNGMHWYQVPGIPLFTDVITLPDDRIFAVGSTGLFALKPGAGAIYEPQQLASIDLLPIDNRSLRHLAFARETLFALEGQYLIVAPLGGTPRVVRLEGWANGVFSVADELFLCGGTPDGSLTRWDWEQGRPEKFSALADQPLVQGVVKVVARAAGGVWMQSDSGDIVGFDGQRTWAWSGTRLLKEKKVTLTDFADLGEDALAVGTADQGLFFFRKDGEVRKHFQQSDGLGGSGVEAIAVDKQGGVWIDASTGLLRLSQTLDFLAYDGRHGLQGHVSSIVSTKDKVYVGTSAGVYTSNLGAQEPSELFRRISSPVSVDTVALSGEDVLFVGRRWSVIDKDGKESLIQQITSSTLLVPSKFPDLAFSGDHEGVHWARRTDGKWQAMGLVKGVERQPYMMAEGPDGSVWVGLGVGALARIRITETGVESKLYGQAEGLPNDWIAVTVVAGRVYSLGGGPLRRLNEATDRFEPDLGMHYFVGDVPFGFQHIIGESAENAYVCPNDWTTTAIRRPVKYVLGQMQLYTDQLDFRAPVLNLQGEDAAWIGSRLGLMRAFKPLVERPASVPKPRLTRIVDLATANAIPFGEGPAQQLRLTARQRSLRFELMFGDLTAPHLDQYQIFLEGFDRDWPAWNRNSFRDFTNLPWGSYSLSVRCKNISGQVTEATTFRFEIATPFYATGLAYGSYALLLVAITIAVASWRVSWLRHQNAGLKRAVEERTADLKTALQSAEDLAQKAQAAAEAKCRFLANMSHEIRTPMNGVIGMCSLLADTPLNAEQQDFVRTIRHSGESLLTIINDVLDFSKIEAGKMELESIPFELRQVCEEVLDILAQQAHAKGLELVARVDPALNVHRIGDPTRIRQVLVNLAGNAIKFTAHGEVAIEVKATRPDDPAFLTFNVRDTGIGIVKEKQDILFKPFSQVDVATTRHYGGTGLGLAISKDLVEKMGGSIRLDSTPGAGTTFSFDIRVSPETVPTHDDEEKKRFAGRRLLIVDDSPAACTALREMAELSGMEVEVASSAAEALEKMGGAVAPDLVVLDHGLPGRNGLELAADIRSRHGPRIGIAVLTTSGVPNRETPGAQHADAFLAKPIHRRLFLETLDRLLDPRTRHPFRTNGAPVAAIPTLAGAANLRVLVAEDNAVNQRLAMLMLRRLGVTADLVANGLEAVDAVRRQRYDLVLMDVHMPELDGIEATRRIRSQETAGRQPKIVAVTAGVSADEIRACREGGMDDFVAKPFHPPELLRVLTAALEARDAVRPPGNGGSAPAADV